MNVDEKKKFIADTLTTIDNKAIAFLYETKFSGRDYQLSEEDQTAALACVRMLTSLGVGEAREFLNSGIKREGWFSRVLFRLGKTKELNELNELVKERFDFYARAREEGETASRAWKRSVIMQRLLVDNKDIEASARALGLSSEQLVKEISELDIALERRGG